MSSPSASSTRKRTENNEQTQPSLKNLGDQPQSGTGANIVLIGPPGSGKENFDWKLNFFSNNLILFKVKEHKLRD